MGGNLKKKRRLLRRGHGSLTPFASRQCKKKPLKPLWRKQTTRCQGRSHVKSNTPCQDQVFSASFENGVHVIALADGAGSAALSHYGAYLAACGAATAVAEKFDEAFVPGGERTFREGLINCLQHRISMLAKLGIDLNDADRKRLGCPGKEEQLLVPCRPRDLASTLLLVAVKKKRYVAVHLGDGVIGLEHISRSGRNTLRVLSSPDNGEFSNETVFVTSAGAEASIRLYRGLSESLLNDVIGFILMSDGPEASLYHKRSATLARACGKLLAACRDLPQLEAEERLNSALRNVIAPMTSDDCSLAIMVR